MRTKTIFALAAGAIALTLMLPTPRSQAMTLPAPAGIAQATEGTSAVQEVRYVCRRYWNGYRWRSRCWWVGPRPHYYRPWRHHHRRYYRW